MNYIREINAFYDLVQVKQLSTGQIALWHALMHINNKCSWAEWFTVPNLTLELISGLSRKGIYNARNTLKQHGLIDFKSNGTKATSYKIIPLTNNTQASTQNSTQDKITMQNITQDTTQGTTQDTTQDSATLNKLNETKLNNINTTSTTKKNEDIFDGEFSQLSKLYQKCGFEVNGLTADWLLGLKEKYSFEWVKNALLEAERQGKRKKKYVEGILENWKRDGGMKLSIDNKNSGVKKPETNSKKNRFHNFEQRTDKYTADQLEEIARKKREEYYKKVQESGN